jgi:ABC-type glycerol-3-phosphate transport system substrate-binding protein
VLSVQIVFAVSHFRFQSILQSEERCMTNESKNTMTRRDFLRYTSMVAGAAALAACAPMQQGAAPAAGGEAAPAAAAEVVIEAWAHWEQGLNWIDTALETSGFWEKHPGWSLNKVVAPFNEVHDKMLAAVSSGVGVPDIARVEQGRMSAFFKGDEVGFAPLNDLIGDRINELVPVLRSITGPGRVRSMALATK